MPAAKAKKTPVKRSPVAQVFEGMIAHHAEEARAAAHRDERMRLVPRQRIAEKLYPIIREEMHGMKGNILSTKRNSGDMCLKMSIRYGKLIARELGLEKPRTTKKA